MKPQSRRIPVRYLLQFRDVLRESGVDTDRLLVMAGIDEPRFNDASSLLSAAEVEAFVSSARQLTGRTDLGFEAGRRIKMNSHELLGYGMLSCRNVDQVLQLASRHYHLITETFTLRYRREDRRGEAIYTPAMRMPLETLNFYYEVLVTSHCNQIRLLLGNDIPPYDCYLSMAEPAHGRRYLALAPARFHFEEKALPGVRVVMGTDLLNLPLPMADQRMVQQIDARCDALGQRPPADDEGWGDYVSMMLRQASGEIVTLEDLARRINISARTLDRHLKKENLQFRDLSQQVRLEKACELLSAPGATVVQVALSLGFSDAANFSRAFRRTMGISPSQFQQNLAGDSSST